MAKKGQAERRGQKKAREQPECRVQKYNRLFQKLNATEKELIKTLAPCCRENNVDETRPSNEKGIAMATSMYLEDREMFNRGILALSDGYGLHATLMTKLFSVMEWRQQGAIQFCLDHEERERDNANYRRHLCGLLTRAYVKDREKFLQGLYDSYATEADLDVACKIIFANLHRETGEKIKFMAYCATDHQDFPDHTGLQLTKLYMETRPEFEARYESKKSHAEMVGRMKQVSKAWNEVCKVSTKWNLMVPSCLLNM
jgi:hypothetical protein